MKPQHKVIQNVGRITEGLVPLLSDLEKCSNTAFIVIADEKKKECNTIYHRGIILLLLLPILLPT